MSLPTAPGLTAQETERLTRRGLRLARFTVAYNLVEGVVAVTVGLLAGLNGRNVSPSDWSRRLSSSSPPTSFLKASAIWFTRRSRSTRPWPSSCWCSR